MYGGDHGGWMFGGSGGWMIFGWLWMALIWLIPILLLFSLFKYLFSNRPGVDNQTPHRNALDILDEKYALGELTREEYLQKRDDIKTT